MQIELWLYVEDGNSTDRTPSANKVEVLNSNPINTNTADTNPINTKLVNINHDRSNKDARTGSPKTILIFDQSTASQSPPERFIEIP